MSVVSDAHDDGLLDACALGASNYAAALKLAALVRSGRHQSLAGVSSMRGARIVVDADPGVEFNCDGELLGLRTPATFSIAGSLRVRL